MSLCIEIYSLVALTTITFLSSFDVHEVKDSCGTCCENRNKNVNPKVVGPWTCSAISLADLEDDNHDCNKWVETKFAKKIESQC